GILAAGTRFQVTYEVNRSPVKQVVEVYQLGEEGVTVRAHVVGEVERIELRLPILASDGEQETTVELAGDCAYVRLNGASQRLRVLEPPGATLEHRRLRLRSRNGWLDAIIAAVPGCRVTYRIG